MVKVNRQELAECVGHALTDTEAQVRAMRELCSHGINLVLLTRGADGMVAIDSATACEGVLAMESVVNNVGCGDALLAGVTKALLDRLPLPEIVRWGVACGTANTQNVGAGFIDKDMVAALLPRVQLRGLTL
jgi:fructose-1-phosphate kinase PfkB-like protein